MADGISCSQIQGCSTQLIWICYRMHSHCKVFLISPMATIVGWFTIRNTILDSMWMPRMHSTSVTMHIGLHTYWVNMAKLIMSTTYPISQWMLNSRCLINGKPMRIMISRHLIRYLIHSTHHHTRGQWWIWNKYSIGLRSLRKWRARVYLSSSWMNRESNQRWIT